MLYNSMKQILIKLNELTASLNSLRTILILFLKSKIRCYEHGCMRVRHQQTGKITKINVSPSIFSLYNECLNSIADFNPINR